MRVAPLLDERLIDDQDKEGLEQIEYAVRDPLFLADLRETMAAYEVADAQWWEPEGGSGGDIAEVDVPAPTPKIAAAYEETFGMFRDDPSFEEFVAEVNQYRATRNQMPD